MACAITVHVPANTWGSSWYIHSSDSAAFILMMCAFFSHYVRIKGLKTLQRPLSSNYCITQELQFLDPSSWFHSQFGWDTSVTSWEADPKKQTYGPMLDVRVVAESELLPSPDITWNKTTIWGETLREGLPVRLERRLEAIAQSRGPAAPRCIRTGNTQIPIFCPYKNERCGQNHFLSRTRGQTSTMFTSEPRNF